MLMPENGYFNCAEIECAFKTYNVFEYLEHCGVEYDWSVRLDRRFTFNMFDFLAILSQLVSEKDLEGISNHIQSAALMMVNASGDDFSDFVEEAVVQTEMEGILKDVEGMLKENE
jgi:hypothetical protein